MLVFIVDPKQLLLLLLRRLRHNEGPEGRHEELSPIFSFVCFCCEGLPIGTITISLVFDFGSDVWVCSGKLQLVAPLLCLLRDPEAWCARVVS